MENIALVYMAGGISSRFGSKAKQFARVGPNGETLIEYSLNQALGVGFGKVIFIVGEKTEKPMKDIIGENYLGINVYYALQKYDISERDKPWGTVDALYSAKEFIDCPFVVCNGDDIYGVRAFRILVNHLKENANEATLAYKLIEALPEKGLTNRGIFEVDKNGYVCSIREVFNIDKSNLNASGVRPDSLCSQNISAFHPYVVEMLSEILNDFKEKYRGDRKIECLLPTEVSKLLENKKIRMKAYPAEERWLGVTNPEDEEVVRKELGKNR